MEQTIITHDPVAVKKDMKVGSGGTVFVGEKLAGKRVNVVVEEVEEVEAVEEDESDG